MNIIDRADDEATEEEEASEAAAASATTSADSNEPYVLAVTACPTGIAHTYMARDALKKQAEKWASILKLKQMVQAELKPSNSRRY